MKNILLKETQENLALVKAMGSRDKQVAYEAQAKLARAMTPVLEQVLGQARVFSSIFKTWNFAEDTSPTLPLDIFYNHTTENEVKVWSQSTPGGLATNFMSPIQSEVPFMTSTVDTAVSFSSKHARQASFPVVQKSLERLAQILILKEENFAAKILLQVLAENSVAQAIDSAATTGVLQAVDFNSLALKASRVYTAWSGGTTDDAAATVTNLFVSPERMFDLRSMAYNPINNKAPANIAATADTGSVVAPDSVRAGLFRAGGIREFYGIALTEIKELGPLKKWTKVYSALNPALSFSSGDDLMLGFDLSKDFALRPTSTGETGAEIKLNPDDQFLARAEKIGFYGSKEIGHLVIDYRPIVGVHVQYS